MAMSPLRVLVLGLALLLVLPATAVHADEGDGIERQVERVKAQIAELREAAEQARKAGRMEKAIEFQRRARDLARELEGMIAMQRAAGTESDVMALRRAIQVLRARGANEELIRALARAAEDIARHGRGAGDRPEREGRGERRIVEGWLEVMGLAKRTLVGADKHDAAHIVEHGMHALELALQGRRDDEAMRIRREAPSRPQQARALDLAAEILQDRRKRREAGWVRELAGRFRGNDREDDDEREDDDDREDDDGEERDGGDDDDDAEEREGLRRRVATLRLAVPVLRESGDGRLIDILERAIRTGDLLLAGRDDEEAQAVYERTPNLGELAEILHHAARRADEQGRDERAQRIMELSRYYGERWRDQQAGRREGEAGERDERDEREAREHRRHRDDDLEHLRRELHELRAHLGRLHEMLEKLSRDRK